MGLIAYYFRKAYTLFKGEVLVLPSRMAVLIFAISLLVLPLFTQDSYLLRILILTNIFAILAASWDLLSGFTGQMNFGHALFFGVAAYCTAILNLRLGLPPWFSIPLGAMGAVLAGLIVGIPCLRLRGTYLALTTLAFPIILLGLVFAIPDVTGGELGISGIKRLTSSRLGDYYVTTLLMLILGFVMWKITDSKKGIILHAIREDEVAVRASGINTTRYKLLAFCLSGFFAGIAGGLYAHFMRTAGPSTLEVALSFQIVIWAVFGGMVSIYGPVAGVFILFPLLEFLRFMPKMRMLAFAIIVLMTLLYMPQGLIPWIREKIEKECPRCKIRNVATRKTCRICTAELD
ncbi:MAG: branched-chain amino acid ABC transporter permease [Deltaproteobacteria bacterium]|jgi:branched-chain amino acid transport system permease protein|nr:branched-chain amino acid ABC transporter permease [Deltaproteobacteria bacterium]